MIYYANPAGAATRAAMDDGLLGCIVTLDQGYNRAAGGEWTFAARGWDAIADNGCFSSAWREDRWWAWVQQVPTSARFVVCPDVADPYGDAETHGPTLERWQEWAPRLRALGHRPAFVCQPGATPDTVPDDAEVLFLGGTDAFKLGPVAESICRAHADRWLHMGRVNSRRRLTTARAFGCDSADGTYLVFGPDVNLPRLLGWLAEAEAAPMLWEAT